MTCGPICAPATASKAHFCRSSGAVPTATRGSNRIHLAVVPYVIPHYDFDTRSNPAVYSWKGYSDVPTSSAATSPYLRARRRSNSVPDRRARRASRGTAGCFQSARAEVLEVDVAIVGAGIIGISIAHRLLTTTSMSVALIDAAQPCAGATGAGKNPLCFNIINSKS